MLQGDNIGAETVTKIHLCKRHNPVEWEMDKR